MFHIRRHHSDLAARVDVKQALPSKGYLNFNPPTILVTRDQSRGFTVTLTDDPSANNISTRSDINVA